MCIYIYIYGVCVCVGYITVIVVFPLRNRDASWTLLYIVIIK